MAFSLRRMFSNISYFSKSGEQDNSREFETNELSRQIFNSHEPRINVIFDPTEPDSTSKQSTSLRLPESMQKVSAKKASLSDTDLRSINDVSKNRKTRKSLKIDVKQASRSMIDNFSHNDSDYIENTPTHKHLECKSADLFSENFKKLNFNESFEFGMTSESSNDNLDVESLSEYSDTDISFKDDEKSEIKMCRKVESKSDEQLMPSATPESFGDVEMDRNEEERISLLLNYQMKFEKMECVLKNLLSEFQFHIEVSKVFNGRSMVTALPDTDVSNIPKMWGQIKYMDNVKINSPSESWNIIMEKEDMKTKLKFKKQLISLKNCIENFVSNYFQNTKMKQSTNKKLKRSLTFDVHKGQRMHKNFKLSNKKREKHFDFPDYRDAFLYLFSGDMEIDITDAQPYQTEDDTVLKCQCCCHDRSYEQSDSGLTMKTDNSNQSITSSIGNFSLDSNTLSAYSESLDQIISYNSFQDTSLLNTLLQKPAVERITFYVQVHSIQLKCEMVDNYESKNVISFFCPACEMVEYEENGLLQHILSQTHCEKIHFLYKTAYIKKCVASGKEIQPSTVLNPMKMYRDDNKIVCFGDAIFACSLCFENFISGESVLMAHCSEGTHVERKNKLFEIFE